MSSTNYDTEAAADSDAIYYVDDDEHGTMNVYYIMYIILIHLEDIVEDIMEDIAVASSTSNDYSPFMSKIHALLFLMMHSPCPIVSILIY